MKIFLAVFLAVFVLLACTDYTHDVPDSQANKWGFENHLGIKPNEQIKDIYFYADELGIDASYYFTFTAPFDVVEEVAKNIQVKKQNEGESQFEYSPPPLSLWVSEEGIPGVLYVLDDTKNEIYKTIWYNPANQHCQVRIVYW